MANPASSKFSNYTIHAAHQYMTWDKDREPAIRVAPGDVVEFRDIDAVCGQLSPNSSVADLGNLDFERVNPVAGPVYVDGAAPGDALKVTILGFDASGWGWTAIIPGFGLLSDDFPEPALHIWSYAKDFRSPAMFGSFAKIPLKPFCGTVGLARALEGGFSTIPPHESGGNMDIRDLTKGVDLYLPVQVPGALFSIGDPHCAQGDGEVCGTGLESPMSVTVRIGLEKGENLKFPRFVTHGPVHDHVDKKGYEATTGIGPDLMQASKDAVRGMIDRLCKVHGVSAAQAYMLCSVASDLRISEIVDQPNWIVSCYTPRMLFD